ncbi:hypothetical protein [Bacillus cereus]|nr:hypothetical protein [Bacillus cereus]MDA2127698.1 hypothetical protein [Bacillus cereus]MDA2150748.1 hypothetical protein [Bacillus cereus]MEB9162384.1 hypothetical protein [Bacillus cereus]
MKRRILVAVGLRWRKCNGGSYMSLQIYDFIGIGTLRYISVVLRVYR